MAKNRFAQPLYGKIIYIYETDLPFEELSTVFDPKTYWIDVTGQDCEVGYIAKYVEGGGIVFSAPESIVEPTETVGGTSSPGAGAYAYTGNPDYNNIAASGSSGLYNHGVVTVTPGQQITVTVGKGGASYKYAPDTSYNSAAYSGYDGFVMIRYGSDIS